MECTTNNRTKKAGISLRSIWFLEDNYKYLNWRCTNCLFILKECEPNVIDLDGNVDVEPPNFKECPCCQAQFDESLNKIEEIEMGAY